MQFVSFRYLQIMAWNADATTTIHLSYFSLARLFVYLFAFNLDKIVLAESKYINELFVLQSVIQKMMDVTWKRQMG